MEGSSKLDEDPKPNLPQEIIIEILTRLPVKSLLRFRCVCKLWLSLISSSQFIRTHLKNSTNSNNYENHTIILGSFSAPVTYYTCSLYSILYKISSIGPIELDIPMRDPFYLSWILGSCNGLLCVSVDPDTLILYNPSMRNFKTLPFSGTDVDSSSYITYGFGYDEFNDDYKVVELCDSEVKVYSLRMNSWRKLNKYPFRSVLSGFGTFVCGKLHWLVRSSNGSLLIFSVDVVSEEFGKVLKPSCEDGEVNWSLMDFNGCLSVCDGCYNVRVDIWVMKEYGIEDSWVKLVSVQYPLELDGHLWPVFVSQNGEVLLNSEQCVMMYKSRDRRFETREIHGHGGSLLVAAPAYVESLVPTCFD